MTSPEFQVPQTPVDIVLPFAELLESSPGFKRFENTDLEKDALIEMNAALNTLGMTREYETRTDMAFVLPEEPEGDGFGHITIHMLAPTIKFTGDLLGARTLKTGMTIGARAVRAVCLSFQDVVITARTTQDKNVFAVLDRLDRDDRMYVPVFSIREIVETN